MPQSAVLSTFTPHATELMDNNPEEISLQEIAETVWARRWLIAAFTLGFGLLALVTAFILPEKYQAAVVLAPVDDDSGGKLGGASALLSQFGGLAGLGGIGLGGSGKKNEAVATLQSAALTEAFIDENKLLPILFEKDWDVSAGQWKTNNSRDTPTLWKAEKKFRSKVRDIGEDKKSGLVTLTITWNDPNQAAAWANDLVSRANRYLRSQAIEQSQKNLSYLNEQLGKTSVVEIQKAIYGLIEAEIKKIMIANGSEEYAFKVIDPARIPEERSSPKRALIASVGLFAGLMFGMVLALALPKRKPLELS